MSLVIFGMHGGINIFHQYFFDLLRSYLMKHDEHEIIYIELVGLLEGNQ